MHYILILILACSATLHAASDDGLDLALWRFGEGTIDDLPASDGTAVRPGQTVKAGILRPLRLSLAGCRDSRLIVAAASAVRLSVVRDGNATDLIAEVSAGAVQFDLNDRGTYRSLLVRGGAMQVRVTGTVFLFERIRQDDDYLAMVSGKVKVKLLKALGQGANEEELELNGRQGLGAGLNGFGSVDQLGQRPQIAAAAADRAGLRTQGAGAGGGWDSDAGFSATFAAEAMGTDMTTHSSVQAAQAVLAEQVSNHVLQQTLDATVQEIINQAVATPPGAHDPIQGPPGHP